MRSPLFQRLIFEVLWKSIVISICIMKTVNVEYCIKTNIICMSGNCEETYLLP